MTFYRVPPKPELSPEMDAVLESVLDEALRDSARLVPPRMLAWMRNELRLQLLMHPYPAALLAELVPPPRVEESGDRPTEGAPSSSSGVASGEGK